MPWGKVTVAAPNAAGYTQNYKRNGVVTHTQAQAMVQAAIADSTARITANPRYNPVPPPLNTLNIGQNMAADPGVNYRVI
ncbi:MAG: hypothetical protein ACJ8DU_01250 [Microvirga sp.]